MPLLDRDEAERLPVVIPQEVIDNNPDAFVWYEGPHGGGFTVPYQFKKYPNRPVNETPMGYLHYIVDKCSSYTKDFHSGFFDAIDTYFEGLMEYARDHYAEFIVPGFSKKHQGKRLQECRDKPWMEWTTKKPYLTQKYTVYFTAVRYFLDDTQHYTANRDIGELLSTTEYEDDLDLVEEDDEYEMNSFINDDDTEEHEEDEEEEESTMSYVSQESTQPSDVEGSQSDVSGGIDSEPYMQTPPLKIFLNGTASLGSTYRLGKRYGSRSPSSTPPSPTPRKRRQGTSKGNCIVLVVLLSLIDVFPAVNSVSKASPRKRRFSNVDSSDHSEDSDDAEEDKPEARQQFRRRKKGPPKAARQTRKGKQKALTSEMEISISGSEESDGNEDYAGSATENYNLSDLADGSKQKLCTSSSNTQCGTTGAQPRQLHSGRKYGPNKSTISKETASKESSPRDRESPGFIGVEISSAVDSGSDESNRLSTRSTPRRTSSPNAQPPLSKRRRTAYRVVSSSEDGCRSPSPERLQAHRCELFKFVPQD
ncbi:uncharacterized protein ARMOST_18742 [Armillaria ostoyae]|uniref:Uncharacterized protein n=1 Tax=Armillaria ostoyae TaxID=47428 RepID=A0A284S2P1_ARMOS|nr:uncharacterized protein ARMOST_18742 [Armillaria ostoyae]